MLDIYLFEPDIDHQERVREICTLYSVKRNADFVFRAYTEIPTAISSEDGCNTEVSIYIIKGSERIKNLSFSILSVNANNYMVLLADCLEDILKYICAEFRPAGVLMKPAEYPAAEKIFDDIDDSFKCKAVMSANQFRFKIRSREYSIDSDSILYFEAYNKKTVLRTAGQAFEFYMPFDEVLKNLPDCFAQIHKSYIVNTKHIRLADYKNMIVETDDGSTIYISRTYKGNLQEKLSVERCRDTEVVS